ncbi:MAG: hypothetical protein IJS56_06500 [Bacilli bacterium]|nr:hypothetical protein [Bacilli bacterium]
MKKYIILILSFFAFIGSCSAIEVTSENIDAVIKNDGSADVTINCTLLPQRESVYKIPFFNVENSKITNISIEDNLNSHYEEADSIEDNKALFYHLDDQNFNKILEFSVISEEITTFTIKFNISNVAVKFKDGRYGIDWFLISRIAGTNIGSLNATIKFENEDYISKIEKINFIGISKSSQNINNNKITFNASSIDSTYNIRFLLLFNDGVNFDSSRSIKKDYNEFIDDAINGRDFKVVFYSYSTKTFLTLAIAIIIVGILIIIGSFIFIRYGTHDEYYGMEIKDKKTINKSKDISYYDSVPCQGDLYKLFFVAGYFKILKNKSDFIGAILFKLYLNDNIELIPGKNGRNIKLRNDMKIDRNLDQDLYNIMLEASDMKVISDIKLNRFSKKHFLRIMTWYNMGYSETITDEFNRNHATRGGKIGKTTKIIFDDNFVDYGNKILSMKKYLLNFNQVPRQTALSEETYKLLLISAQMLGIGQQVAEEILRKNPNNIYAKKLLDFQNVNYIFKDIYAISLSEYRQTVKNNEIYNYDEMRNESMSSTSNVIVYNRKSKL